MIFKKICIQNLFPYYGEQVFDLPPPTRKRPVILIAGRNGFGKTSFINSVKLLFLGTADEMLRNVQTGMTLRPNSYLLVTDISNTLTSDSKHEQDPLLHRILPAANA